MVRSRKKIKTSKPKINRQRKRRGPQKKSLSKKIFTRNKKKFEFSVQSLLKKITKLSSRKQIRGLWVKKKILQRNKKKEKKRGIVKKKKIVKIVWNKGSYLFFASIGKLLLMNFREIIFSIGSTILIILFAYGIYDYLFIDLPSPTELREKKQNVSTRIFDRQGRVLYRIYEDENRTIVPLSSISKHLVEATIAIEDHNFFEHQGFSVRGIIRAFISNFRGKAIQGGSTITQQLIKNRLLGSQKTLKRKLRETILSVLIEGTYSKDEILEMYLNQVPYGGSIYGIEEAAWKYFNKSARDLTLAESALLAGLPAAPSVYTPFGSNLKLTYLRRDEVLRRMVEEKYITLEQAKDAKKEILVFNQNMIGIQAPHFVMYVRKLLAEKYGEERLRNGGLQVITTLDLDLQNQVQKIVTNEVMSLYNMRVTNGASLVTNPTTGEILAMVGSIDFFDFEHDGQVNVVLRPRQPGSSIKPLTYALAFEQGKHPSTIINDAPISYSLPGSKPYRPRNYDGTFHGKVTLRRALASSYNIPAVKLLASIGVDKMIDKAQKIGVSTWDDRKRFGLALTLGGGEVLMLDMAKIYGTFANDGFTTKINPFLEIRDSKGNLLYHNACIDNKNQCEGNVNISSKIAYQISDILSDNQARSSAFGYYSVLNIPNQQVAVKTGTTNNMRDNWAVGYTQDRLVAVWIGNNDNRSMGRIASGAVGASSIWRDVMFLLLDSEKPHLFQMPDDLVKVRICQATGTLPCIGCPKVVEEYFIYGTEPKIACNPNIFKPTPTEESEHN